MSARTNIIFDDEVWEALQQTPRGERSRIVNEAVAEWLKRKARREADERIRVRRRRAMPANKPAEVLIAEDREAHQ